MPLEMKDIIIGDEYEFCDPGYPHFWGHRGIVIFKGSLVTVRSTRDSDNRRFVPIGETAQHSPSQLRLVHRHESELLFS